jgi:high frequency lysogenization protein
VKDRWQDRTLAFAAVFQAGQLVDQLAKTGSAPERNVKSLLDSVFIFDAEQTEDVYGGDPEYRHGLDLGLQKLLDIFDRSRRVPRSRELIEYSVGLLYLHQCLAKNGPMLAEIGERLRRLKPLVDSLGSQHPDVISKLADIYKSTLSTLKFRIHVRGERERLQDPTVANTIRALLLAGVRAAILWHQLGGRRWQLPFTRNRTLLALQAIS